MRNFLVAAVLVLVFGAAAEAGWRCRQKAAPCGNVQVQTCAPQTFQYAPPTQSSPPVYSQPTFSAPAVAGCSSCGSGQRLFPNFTGGFSVGTTCGPGGCSTGLTGPFGNTVGVFRGRR